jgi:hypothetical protein
VTHLDKPTQQLMKETAMSITSELTNGDGPAVVKRGTTRALTVLAAATAVSWAGAGAATAAPSEPGIIRSSYDYASVFIVEGDVFSDFNVYAPPGQQPFARGEFSVLGYDCFPDNDVAAEIDPLTSATAAGTLHVTCYWHGDWEDPNAPEVLMAEGTVSVDLTWSAEGRVTRMTTAGPYTECVGHLQIRHATVTGGVQVVIPDLGFDQFATAPGDNDDTLRHEEMICRPQRESPSP